MKYHGLREWLAVIAARGDLTTLENVDWNLEMGAIVDVLYRASTRLIRRPCSSIESRIMQRVIVPFLVILLRRSALH